MLFSHNRLITLAAIALTALVLLAAGCARGPVPADKPQQGLTVNIIDVGQGDAILIRTPGQVTLIDTGDVPARDKLVSFIKSQGITVIDNLIISHPHSDHIGGAAAVFDNFTVRRIYDSGQTTTSALYRQYLTTIKKKGISFETVTAPRQIDLGDGAFLKFFGPGKPFSGTESDLNNNSIVAKLIYGEFSLLLPGDAEKEAEESILSKFAAELKSTVLKAGHHGSSTSSSQAFLKAVKPDAVIISVGGNNEYHHPHPSTIKRFNGINTKIYRTDAAGTITITSDGKSYTITKEK